MKNKPKIKVPEFMTSNVLTINQITPVREAMNEMKEYCSSSLIVARHHEDYEYGVTAITDIANLVVAKNLSFDRVDVYEIMRKPVLTLHPETDIHHAINIINRFKISRAAVLDDARTLLIIVTLRDMVLRYAVAREGGQ
tara:strand:- start:475 stop:891 length:417 start_codon:yes stop_codon:yes gene_type:complete